MHNSHSVMPCVYLKLCKDEIYRYKPLKLLDIYLFSCKEAALEVQMLKVCLFVVKIEFHRKRQVEAGRERQRQVEKRRDR